MNKSKDNKIIYIPIECTDCQGTGMVEHGPICFKPASDCCGGCFQESPCDTCNSQGIIEIDQNDDELYDKYIMYQSVNFRITEFSRLVNDFKLAIDACILEANENGYRSLQREHSQLQYEIIRHRTLLERLHEDIMNSVRNF